MTNKIGKEIVVNGIPYVELSHMMLNKGFVQSATNHKYKVTMWKFPCSHEYIISCVNKKEFLVCQESTKGIGIARKRFKEMVAEHLSSKNLSK